MPSQPTEALTCCAAWGTHGGRNDRGLRVAAEMPAAGPGWRHTTLRIAETLPYQGALLVMAAVIAIAIPATPKGSWAPGTEGVAAFATVVTVRAAAQAGVRTVQRRMLRRGWGRG